ncbi:OmpH family outer membrane protein, partial [bacterium]|nr:OmpH family outer membrane protein [bacterium]
QNNSEDSLINLPEIRGEYYLVKQTVEAMTVKEEEINESRISVKLRENKKKFDAAAEALYTARQNQDETDEKLEALGLVAEAARGDFQNLYEEWQTWQIAEVKKLSQEIAIRQRKSYDLVQAATQRVGEKMDFDIVFDIMGGNSSQLPIILDLRNGTDISKEVIAELNKDAPVEEESVPEVADPKN